MKRGGILPLVFVISVLVGLRIVLLWEPIKDRVDSTVNTLGSTVLSIDTVQSANADQLREEARVAFLLDENKELRDQLALSSKNDNRIGAEVVRLDLASYKKSLWINKGREQNIQVGSAILHNGFLVGKVVNVTKSTSEVQVITDPEFSVTARYDKEHGVVKNEFGSIIFGLVPTGSLEAGKIIVTDGIDGNFQPGIPVAIISGNITQPGEVFYRYNVYLEQNPSNIRFVEVVR